jgi:phage FluMu protein Com
VGGMNSMVQFQLERKGNGTKRCRKMKQMQWARLGLMERKCVRCDSVTMLTREEAASRRRKGMRRCQLG